ncbi:nuclease A inhibitor family protein [Chitinophagaceae bacterium MMS25-I14]
MDTATIKTELAALTDGLLYISESENKFDIIDAGRLADNAEIPAAFTDVSGSNAGDFKTSDLSAFFSKVIDRIDTADDFMVQQAKRYTTLRDFLAANMQAINLLRAGKPVVHLFISGNTEEGDIIALHTIAIET